MFFTFSQNNSGGDWEVNKKAGIGYYVIVEADNVEDANSRAEKIGLYFNGCDDGRDCSCCGDRWNEQYDKTDGTKIPEINGEDVSKGKTLNDMWGLPSFIHYKNGKIKKITTLKKELI